MTETVGFAWWMPSTGGSQQAFVGNYTGLEAAGFEVRAYTNQSLPQMIASAAGLDWALVPFVFDPEPIAALADETHVHLQIGGYGADDFDAAREAIAAADTVSVLDPQLADAFGVPDAPWIPNPPNAHLFDATDSESGPVLVPKAHESGGLGPAREVVAAHPDREFVVLGASLPDPPPNVRVRPKVPWSWMPRLYADASAVLNPREREGLPNVAYEAFLTATPYVALDGGAIGDTQAAVEPLVEYVGRPARDPPAAAVGDHFATTLGDATPAVGRAGREWAEQWAATGWDWVAKADAIRELVGP